MRYIATNLHVQHLIVFRNEASSNAVSTSTLAEANTAVVAAASLHTRSIKDEYICVTLGAPAAHSLGFENGMGLHQMGRRIERVKEELDGLPLSTEQPQPSSLPSSQQASPTRGTTRAQQQVSPARGGGAVAAFLLDSPRKASERTKHERYLKRKLEMLGWELQCREEVCLPQALSAIACLFTARLSQELDRIRRNHIPNTTATDTAAEEGYSLSSNGSA